MTGGVRGSGEHASCSGSNIALPLARSRSHVQRLEKVLAERCESVRADLRWGCSGQRIRMPSAARSSPESECSVDRARPTGETGRARGREKREKHAGRVKRLVQVHKRQYRAREQSVCMAPGRGCPRPNPAHLSCAGLVSLPSQHHADDVRSPRSPKARRACIGWHTQNLGGGAAGRSGCNTLLAGSNTCRRSRS